MGFGLLKADDGALAPEVCCEMGIGQQTLHRCRKKFRGMGVARERRLCFPEEQSELSDHQEIQATEAISYRLPLPSSTFLGEFQ